MNKPKKTIEIKVERIIPAPLGEVFDAWLNPKIPGNPWNAAERFILDPKVDGLFFWKLKGTSHYGRFTEMERPGRIQHTWMSRNTLGEESTVTVTFKKQGEDTLMTLVHSELPD
ncbi:MAG TPA: SRPBCC domain-containing protein, partial [Verrucomicrobiae bacterium]|nr:SRPBCC domain-containing protein [Verrucomicrobiae bacterium]